MSPRRRRVHVLKIGQALGDLDLWPHDEVIADNTWVHLAVVNARGQLAICF